MMGPRANWWWHMAGWLVFIVSAVFFIAAAWSAGDWMAMAGSLAFLIACFVFIVPLMHALPPKR